jgi:hypothetical protein
MEINADFRQKNFLRSVKVIHARERSIGTVALLTRKRVNMSTVMSAFPVCNHLEFIARDRKIANTEQRKNTVQPLVQGRLKLIG